jgi:putative ATP-dependent endonuclease of OLD family
MRIVLVEIENFRGIKKLEWTPAAKMNCLIGPGDSTKTTILDAIEMALNPRSYAFADDSDFFDLDFNTPAKITITLADLPAEFKADDRYGMYLRGWDAQNLKLEDEPRDDLDHALSVRLALDGTLEGRWSIFNQRIGDDEPDPPALRYKDARQVGTTRLGPYAEHHLGWGRQSVLVRLGESGEGVSRQLAEAKRAAREAFRQGDRAIFKTTVERAEQVGKDFSVPVREKYAAELDVQGVSITAGGISLHDGKLPLSRLGSGSSRLIVAALQHDAGSSHVALIDEIEHGLEPHRIARLLRYLSAPAAGGEKARPSQVFMTTHSPVVVRELTATDIFAVRCKAGVTEVKSVAGTAKDLDTAQRHLRGCPDAFFARKVVVGEGRTEQGLVRGLDRFWSIKGNRDSFALRGAVAIAGNGNTKAPVVAEHLLELGYDVFMLTDSDQKADAGMVETVKKKGGVVVEWAGDCSTEERIFLDVPWDCVGVLVAFAAECVSTDSVRDNINNACKEDGVAEIGDLTLPSALDCPLFRRTLGRAAKRKSAAWFKDITRGERLGEIVGERLDDIPDTPLAQGIARLRQWVDG